MEGFNRNFSPKGTNLVKWFGVSQQKKIRNGLYLGLYVIKKKELWAKKKNHNVFELIFLKCKMEENFSLRLVVKSKNNSILIYSECGAVSNEVGNMYVCLNLIFTTSMWLK